MTRTRTVKSLLAVAAVGLTTFAFANPLDKIWEAAGSSGGSRMKSKYVESPENGGLDQSLEVEVDNGIPNTVYRVFINTSRIGAIRTDGVGHGVLSKDRLNVPVGPDGRPSGPRINEGDTCTVKSATQTITGTYVQTQ